ncbi:MAG: hypothetical protein H7125_12330 [Proteobacteria bacterium]|nr:hypothetical protein [Burkholderiales bacterium]
MHTVLPVEPSQALSVAPAVIDVEASGFGKGSYPIEVGFVLPDGTGDCMLIRPCEGWVHWDPAAERLHRIPREHVVRHGRPIIEVVARLDAELEGRTIYTDGWGSDYSWLSMLYEVADRSPTYHLDSLQKLLTEDQLLDWHRVKDEVSRETASKRHRASADARVLQATVVRLLSSDRTDRAR